MRASTPAFARSPLPPPGTDGPRPPSLPKHGDRLEAHARGSRRKASAPTSRGPLDTEQHIHETLKKKKIYPHKMPCLQVKKKKKILLLLTPGKGRGGDGSGGGASRSRFNPARHDSSGLPGRMEIGAAATRSNPSPPKSRRRGSLTQRVNGSAGQEHLGVRRAEKPSRSSAAADSGAVSRQTKPEMAKRSDG